LYKASFFNLFAREKKSFERKNLGKPKEVTLGLRVFGERFLGGKHFTNTFSSEI
jgi:hypothetical protein